MLEKGKISCTQTVFLLANLVGATAIIFLPAITSQDAGRDSWLAPVISTLPGIYLALVIGALGKRFPGRTLIQYLQSVLSAWPGKAAGLFYLFFFLHTNGIIIREFGELLVSLVMPNTPLIVFHSVILLLCAWAIRGGLEVLARVLAVTWPFLVFLFVASVLLAFNEMDFSYLLPVLENGIPPVLKSSLAPTAWRGEIIVLAMFLPFLTNPGKGKRCALISVFLIGIILTADAIANTVVFGPSTARLTFPTFSLIRMVSVSNFLERIESVIVALWVIGMFSKISLFYYVTVLGTAQLFNLKDYRPLVFPMGVLLAALSIQVAANAGELVDYITKPFPPFAYVFEYIIPTILLAISYFQKPQNLKT